MIITKRQLICSAGALLLLAAYSEARALQKDESSAADVVIPSPNQEFGDEPSGSARAMAEQAQQAVSRGAEDGADGHVVKANAPSYMTPYARGEKVAATSFESQQESSHAPPNYVPRPAASSLDHHATVQKDLKTAASYGHGHHDSYDHSGWLDMGAWTGGKGSFGWYSDFPVGGKHGR